MSLRCLLTFLLPLGAPAAGAQAALSGVVINEILADPNSPDGPNFDTDGDGVAEDTDEFVELFNAGAEAADLSGWRIHDASATRRHTFADGTVLAPGAYLVVVGKWDPGTPPPGIVVANGTGGGSPGLGINNDGDELFLYDPDANAYVGAFFNGGQAPFTGPDGATNAGEDDFGQDTDGESLQRAPSGGVTVVSATPTPLGGVPVAAEAGPEAADFALSAPRPNPAAGAAALTLTVAQAAAVEVSVHDVLGRRVAVLASGPMAAGRHELCLDLAEASLPAGAYVVRAVAHAVSGAGRGGAVATARLTLVR